jgi:tetratricopeptide (TPR) repeat protein
MESAAMEIAATGEGRPLGTSEASSYWMRRTWEERGSTGALAAHLARKALFFWNATEAGSTHELSIERQFSACLAALPATSWWLLAAGAAGWWIARRRAPALDFAAAAIVLTWAALTVFFPLSRYRAPVLPLAAAAAAAGLAEVVLSGTTKRRALAAAGVMVAALGLSLLPLRAPLRAGSWNNLATAFEEEGERANAYDMLQRAAAEEPGDGPVHQHLGSLLLDDGHPDKALEQFVLAKDDERTAYSAGVPAVLALVLLGRANDAEAAGTTLLHRDVQDERLKAELLAYLAFAAHERRDLPTADFRMLSAKRLAPDDPAVVRIGKVLWH